MNKKILVFGAHPDDAEISCGGTICKATSEGDQAHVIVMTCSKPIRAEEAKTAAKIMGASVELWDFPDGSMLLEPKGMQRVLEAILAFQPDVVYAHWPVDFHPDHQVTGCLVLRAMNQLELQRKPEPWPTLRFFTGTLGYQTYHFQPNCYVDITSERQRKREAVACHASVNVLNSYPATETANKAFGYQSGYSYAEGFIDLAFRRGATRDNVVGEGRELSRPS